MSKRHGRLSDRCPRGNGTSKESFRSAAKARQAIIEHRHNDVRLYPYQCPHCGHWHITSKEQA